MPIVFTNGCFDLFHAGHVSTLEYCRYLAGGDGVVHVGLNSDISVARTKGRCRPIISERERAHILLSNRHVDHVTVFDEDTPYELIKRINPDIIVKGPDYRGFEDQVIGADLAEVKCCLASTYPHASTSYIIGRIIDLEEKREESSSSR